MKIVCASICKNESHNIPSLIENLIKFDITELLVVDTGSTDGSLELLENCDKIAVKVKQVAIEPFNFSQARNTLKELISDDVDFVLHLDMDERIQSLPKQFVLGKGYSGDRKETLYNMVSKDMHRLTPRSGWNWIYPIHEHMLHEHDIIYDENFVIDHFQKPDKDCYESLTEIYFETDPNRLYFHRLTDLIHNSKYDEFAKLFKKYGTWNLTGQQKWLAVKNYQSSLLMLNQSADPDFFNVLVDANSSSSWYYLFLCYDSIGKNDRAFQFLTEATEVKFPEENEIKFFNMNVKNRALVVARNKKYI
jgi:glycosyltransferase involved in cell wall biosynthesis